MKDFFDGTFWRWFGIGFVFTFVWLLLNAIFKIVRDYGLVVGGIIFFVYALNNC
jgi:hypothetical protein